jgi:hypothetical protein
VSGRISPKWGKHSQIENPCGIFSPYGKNNPIGFFPLVGFFMGKLIGLKTPPKKPWVFMF